MTREDVISWLEYLSDDARSKADGLVPTNIEIACGMAIDALKAQEPKNPIVSGKKYGNYLEHCPSCGIMLPNSSDYGKSYYCYKCGQVVKWE